MLPTQFTGHPIKILQQHNSRGDTMRNQHPSNYLSLYSLIVPISLNCTLKFILVHFLQSWLFHFKIKTKHKTPHLHTQKWGKYLSNYLTLLFPIRLLCSSFLFKSPDNSLRNFLPLHTCRKLQAIHLEAFPFYFFWQPFCAFESKYTYNDADQSRKI